MERTVDFGHCVSFQVTFLSGALCCQTVAKENAPPRNGPLQLSTDRKPIYPPWNAPIDFGTDIICEMVRWLLETRALTATAPICYLVGESLDGFLSSFSTDVLTTIIKKNCKQDKINIFYANEAHDSRSKLLIMIIMVQ